MNRGQKVKGGVKSLEEKSLEKFEEFDREFERKEAEEDTNQRGGKEKMGIEGGTT